MKRLRHILLAFYIGIFLIAMLVTVTGLIYLALEHKIVCTLVMLIIFTFLGYFFVQELEEER